MKVELGKIVGVWGIKGWVKLHSYTRNRSDISQYKRWFLSSPKTEISDSLTAYTVLECRQQGVGIVAKLECIDDRDQAAALIGNDIFVNQSDLPTLAEGEYYWQELIGLTVSNAQQTIGVVDSVLETGANDVLVCKHQDTDKADILIPYISQVIKQIDIETGTLLVDWDPLYLE